jgi:hypothetical protein
VASSVRRFERGVEAVEGDREFDHVPGVAGGDGEVQRLAGAQLRHGGRIERQGHEAADGKAGAEAHALGCGVIDRELHALVEREPEGQDQHAGRGLPAGVGR